MKILKFVLYLKILGALQFTNASGDEIVVIGGNSSYIELKWNIDLQRKSYDRTKIFKSLNSDFSFSTLLYNSSPYPQILAEYQSRMNVTIVVDSGAVTVTMVIRNVTLSDQAYYRLQVETTDGSQATNTSFVNVYGENNLLCFPFER